MDDRRAQVTAILERPGDDPGRWAELLPIVYEELRELAARRLGSERAGHTLQATALVHEAWMRLAGDGPPGFSNRRHFCGAAAEAMRRVLVDHARKVRAAKRGGNRQRVELTVMREWRYARARLAELLGEGGGEAAADPPGAAGPHGAKASGRDESGGDVARDGPGR